MNRFWLSASALLFATQAFASVSVKNGTISINVSGADGQYYGSSGSSAGDVDITLSYADQAKTIVNVTGTTSHYGKTDTVNQQIALKDLKAIVVYATGGDGQPGEDGSNGYSGSDGYNGSDGSNGYDGCPPGSGGNGSDGQAGGDGGPGGDGGNGGNGGRGGSIKVSTSPDQNELMLYVQTYTHGGSGGNGGSGGYGGSGGRGGRGGAAGQGGRNTCTDDKGNPTGGPDGSSGWAGSDGRDGSSGSSGSDGSGGYGGRSGATSYNLVGANGTQAYAAPFDLHITSTTFVDDSGDAILEPGERAYVTALEVTNKGPMPSPAGQAIRFSVQPSSTLLVPAALSATLPEIAPGAKASLALKKGSLTLQVPDDNSLIGKKATTTAWLSINNVSESFNVDSGMAVHWPVSVSAAVTKVQAGFEADKALTFNLKNVSSKVFGAGGEPLFLEFRWTSKAVPASDVTLKLADGRALNLGQNAVISDFSVPANGSAPLTIGLFVRDSLALNAAAGDLQLRVLLRDPVSTNEEQVQALDSVVNLALDLNAIVWNQTVSLAGQKIQCVFPKLPVQNQIIASFQVAKAKGANKLTVQVTTPSSSSSTSPAITVPAARMMPYYEAFTGTWTATQAADFLNKLVAPYSPAGAWNFKACTAQ